MMKFLGTGAGEGTPDPFCSCRVCENARRVGGREIRMRSGFMLDDKTAIDLGGDYLAATMVHRVSLEPLEHLLLSHTHDDHFSETLFWERIVRRKGGEQTLKVYLTGDAYGFFTDYYTKSSIYYHPSYLKGIEVIRLEHGKTYDIGGYSVTPLKGRHGTRFEKVSANFLIKKDGRSLYYAIDSAYFLDETFDALAGERLDTLIIECTETAFDHKTNLPKQTGNMQHHNVDTAIKTLDRLYELKAITEDTHTVITHIAPIDLTHEEFCSFAASLDKPYKLEIAYDGMELAF